MVIYSLAKIVFVLNDKRYGTICNRNENGERFNAAVAMWMRATWKVCAKSNRGKCNNLIDGLSGCTPMMMIISRWLGTGMFMPRRKNYFMVFFLLLGDSVVGKATVLM